MSNEDKKSKTPGANLRQHQKEGEKQMLYLVVFGLVVGGSGLVGLIFGWEALLSSLPCLVGGVLLILVPWGLLTLVQKWRDKMEV